jgi:hypothetical protein
VTPTVAVVIVNYNAGPHLRRCVNSVVRAAGVAVETVIIDNASADDRLEDLATVAGVSVIRNARNVGFGAAVNQGVRDTSAPLVLVLNPDCELTAGALPRLVRELTTTPSCAVVAPQVLNEDGSYQGNARGDPGILAGLFGRSRALTRRFPWLAVGTQQVVAPEAVSVTAGSVDVDWVSGACLLVSRGAFDLVGGFDEAYFLFWEDADLCRRLRGAGFGVRFCPDARVVHAVGVSRRTSPAPSIRAFHAGAERYYTTHVAPSRWSPRRWLAVAILRVRCWLALRKA